jgi:hypothetical protein
MFNLFGNAHQEVGSAASQKVAKAVKLVKESGPAVSLDKIQSKGGTGLLEKTKAVGSALDKAGLGGIRAQAVLVLDFSGSMSYDYRDGHVQELAERFLAFALQIDADGEVPIIPFASNRLPTINVTLDNYQGIIDRELVRKQRMGTTDLASALKEVKRLAESTDAPLFVGIVTDGAPDSESATTQIVCELASYPCFLKFLALRDVSYLHKLDNLPDSKRLLDNVNAQSFNSLGSISDQQFAQAVVEEWSDWVNKAKAAGVLN